MFQWQQQRTRDDVGARGGTTYSYLRKAMFCSQVQVRAALVLVVWIAQVVGVVADDALHERQVVQQDGATQAPRYINPAHCQRLLQDTWSGYVSA